MVKYLFLIKNTLIKFNHEKHGIAKILLISPIKEINVHL